VKRLLFALTLVLTACGHGGSDSSATSGSLLAGRNAYIYDGVSLSSVVEFQPNNLFNWAYLYACNGGGAWYDSNVGDSIGTVSLTYNVDNCNNAYNGQTFQYRYVIWSDNISLYPMN
jgi:hypothetical protein